MKIYNEDHEPTDLEIAEAVADIETDPTLEDIWGVIEDELERLNQLIGDQQWD
jgi:hypothetical protein